MADTSQSPTDPYTPKKKLKRTLRFKDDDDKTPITQLIHNSTPALTPKTPKKHESESAHTKATEQYQREKAERKAQRKVEKQKHKAEKILLKKQACLRTTYEPTQSQAISTLPKFTVFKNMTQDNQMYSVRIKVLHYWYISASPIVASPTGFLVVKDEEGSLMEVILPDFIVEGWKDRFTRGMCFELRNVMLLGSSRRTKKI